MNYYYNLFNKAGEIKIKPQLLSLLKNSKYYCNQVISRGCSNPSSLQRLTDGARHEIIPSIMITIRVSCPVHGIHSIFRCALYFFIETTLLYLLHKHSL